MKPMGFDDANVTYVIEESPADTKLPVRVTTMEDAALGAVTVIISLWELDDAEREVIARGGNVELTVVGEGQPPVVLGVTDGPWTTHHDRAEPDHRPPTGGLAA